MEIWSKSQARLATFSSLGIGLTVSITAYSLFNSVTSVLISFPLLAATTWFALIQKYHRRRMIAKQTFPESYQKILENGVSFYQNLDDNDRHRFEQFVLIFLLEQKISSVGAHELTDEARVLIAAGAITLIFHRPEWDYSNLREILVYDDAFDHETFQVGHQEYTLGLAGKQIPIILSLKHLRQGFRHAGDGFNLVYHEFAHIIDLHDVGSDANPLHGFFAGNLLRGEMNKAFQGTSVLRDYAAQNEAEFFAVATEFFFEKPDVLYEHHPQLYRTLRNIFNFDPANQDPDDVN